MSIIVADDSLESDVNPLDAPVKTPAPKISEEEEKVLNELFASEIQKNMIVAIFSLINQVSGKYVTFHAEELSTRINQSEYLKRYVETKFGKIFGFLSEDVRAAIVLAVLMSQSSTIGVVEDFEVDDTQSFEASDPFTLMVDLDDPAECDVLD